ncbi:XrtA-associated tyrosine autokinase [Glaciecola sp. SC05]|uniref:XrtA-associated tyrosine autokinase n=1 Tax=Glaciecola sp. SC05 TaxID=1987355 RepID=UPI003526D382
MKSTIEKALQRQKEAEAAKLADAEVKKHTSTTDEGAEIPDDAGHNSLERATEKKKNDEVVSAGADKQHKITDEPIEILASSTEVPSSVKSDAEDDPARYIEIDLERLEKLGFVTLTNARRQINEEYREIKRKLIQNAFGPLSKTLPNANIIMVSSARPSEGKTFSAVNLALSIAAEQDKTVLLVDADVLKPNVLRTLDVDARQGLMDYLLGETDNISNVIYRTNVPKLRIIPAGSSHHLSTELLASGIMNETVNEFSTRYKDRVVIIDTPPIIGINESAILASFAGQAVIVVEEGKSKLHDIQQSVERLNPDMAIGFLVNKSIANSETGGYYGYSYYGSERDD